MTIEKEKNFEDDSKVKKQLTTKQKLFCQYYASPEYFANWVQAYMKAYWVEYDTAKTSASRYLRNDNICLHIASLLDDNGFNDANVDKQLLFLINQNDDFAAKRSAIAEYNKLKSRITTRTITEVKITEEEQGEVNDLIDQNLG